MVSAGVSAGGGCAGAGRRMGWLPRAGPAGRLVPRRPRAAAGSPRGAWRAGPGRLGTRARRHAGPGARGGAGRSSPRGRRGRGCEGGAAGTGTWVRGADGAWGGVPVGAVAGGAEEGRGGAGGRSGAGSAGRWVVVDRGGTGSASGIGAGCGTRACSCSCVSAGTGACVCALGRSENLMPLTPVAEARAMPPGVCRVVTGPVPGPSGAGPLSTVSRVAAVSASRPSGAGGVADCGLSGRGGGVAFTGRSAGAVASGGGVLGRGGTGARCASVLIRPLVRSVPHADRLHRQARCSPRARHSTGWGGGLGSGPPCQGLSGVDLRRSSPYPAVQLSGKLRP